MPDRAREATAFTDGQTAWHELPRLNDLLPGRIEKLSHDAWVNILARIGRWVNVTVDKAASTTLVCARLL